MHHSLRLLLLLAISACWIVLSSIEIVQGHRRQLVVGKDVALKEIESKNKEPNFMDDNSRFCGCQDCGRSGRSGKNGPQLAQMWPMFATVTADNSSLFCGAVIIGLKYVVSSQSCLYEISNKNPERLRVMVGSNTRNPKHFAGKILWTGTICDVVNHVIIPSVNGFNRSERDLSILMLETELEVNKEFQLACLNGTMEMLKSPNSDCVVVVHENQEISSAPVEFEKCWLQTEQGQFCFKGKNKQVALCRGNSGSPVMCRKEGLWYLIGTVATVVDKCSDGLPELGIHNVATSIPDMVRLNVTLGCAVQFTKNDSSVKF